MSANGLLIIKCKFILLKIKINALLSVRKKKLPGLNITYDEIRIKQFHIAEYLGCSLDANLSGEPMEINSLKEINAKLKLLYRQNKLLNLKLLRLLSNSLIQPHFDYVCISWYPLVSKSKKIRKKI